MGLFPRTAVACAPVRFDVSRLCNSLVAQRTLPSIGLDELSVLAELMVRDCKNIMRLLNQRLFELPACCWWFGWIKLINTVSFGKNVLKRGTSCHRSFNG